MNALTASLIVVAIGAAAFVAAAWLTARSRIGVLPAKPDPPVISPVARPAGRGQAISCLRLGPGGAALSRGRVLPAARLERAAHRPPLGAMGSHLRQRPERPSGNRALFEILDRDGDRALGYRLLGATAFKKTFVWCLGDAAFRDARASRNSTNSIATPRHCDPAV